ncbi:serine-rich adhesin for platelets-like [Zophobas morio]|uniref:serine-rich adhesin for platelets-like n=1 Tax=Zophobas morio TaxID=2755281 RepID=UPI003083CA61
MFPQVCLFILLFIKCYGYQDSCCSDYNRYRIPQDVMIDVVNNLALKLLAIHNEGNDNNIAISPYGAVSVLVALKEGVRGSAAAEIHRATGIPSDLSVIRIGLRDIHRHLKSYFIPEEGFLSGLTLSHDNVTLNREYEDILRFYGFDINSFNNALYPDFSTTEGITSTTEEVSTTTEVGTTTDVATSTAEMLVATTEQSTTTEKISEKEEMTSTMTSTTESVPTTTENARITRSERPSTITETVPTTSEASTTTHSDLLLSTSTITQTTVEETTTGGNTEASTTLVIETTSSSDILTTPTEQKSTTNLEVTTETTTAQTASETSTTSSQTSTLSLTSTETAEITPSTEEILSQTSTENKIVSEEEVSDSSMIQMSTTQALESSDSSDLNDGSEAESTTEMSTSSTTIVVDSTTNTVQLNDETTKYSDESKNNNTSRRNARSVVDYIIARYYDDHAITQRPPPYNSENDLYFLVNDKYKETNINYMTYDTVLPFHYISHLKTLALRFPLDSSKYYLLLLLPENPKQLNRLICDIRLSSSLKYIIDNLRYTHVKAIIPSFMLKGYVILTSTFQKMGINRVFEPRQADFSPMTSDKGIYVTNIEQAITVNIKNYVDPDTMNNNRYLHRANPVLFKADHPFLYFVIDSEIDVTLMAGKIVNPLNSRIR